MLFPDLPQCPSTGERIKKIRYILNIYSGIKFIQEKDVLLFVTTWLELEGIMLSEKSLREKDKYCMILPISLPLTLPSALPPQTPCPQPESSPVP